MPIDRSTLAGISTGVVLLAGVAGFGIGLPEVTGSAADETVASVPKLPAKLGGLTALSTLTAEDAGAKTEADRQGVDQFVEAAATNDATAAKHLSEQYGDAAVRAYVDVKGMTDQSQAGRFAQFTATVVPGDEPGLLISGGPYEGDAYKLQTIDGYRCSVAWSVATAGAEPTDLDYQVECRTSADGLTYDVYTLAMPPEDAAAALKELVDATQDS